MQFIDLKKQQARIREDIEAGLQAVLDHGKYIMGPEVSELERSLAEYVGSDHAVACSSGTDALLCALMALNAGPGDAVLTSPFTFIASAEVISLLGATPVFVDIDPQTFNIDPAGLRLALEALSDPSASHPLPDGAAGLRPKAVIAVDLFGLPAEYEEINSIADEFGITVIQDAAQSFGSEYRGRKACTHSAVGCTSFFPAKPLGCYGDGGMVFTDDPELAEAMRSIILHGKGSEKYDNVRVGINGRLDTLQAAVLLAKMRIFPEEVRLRQEAAKRYKDLLSGGLFTLPEIPADRTSVWAQYSILAENEDHRREGMQRLKAEGVPSVIYYPRPLHLQTAYAGLGLGEGSFPVSEDASRRIFSLPMHPYLTEEDQRIIAKILLAS
jgi:dTDP-4-amino-4,6-dideoxygalactose transaminase